MVVILGLVAFAVDVGYLVMVKTELQNAADAAALAGTSCLLDPSLLRGNPNPTSAMANARAEAQEFSMYNKAGSVYLDLVPNPGNASTGDVVCGYLADPADPSAEMTYTPFPNSVKVIVRRDNTKNGPLPLFFGRILRVASANLQATATATYEGGVTGIHIPAASAMKSKFLPITLHVNTWTSMLAGSGPDNYSYNRQTGQVSSGSDGIRECKLYPVANGSSGNSGTVNVPPGKTGNSTSVLSRIIREGPNANDLSGYANGEMKLDPLTNTLPLNGDTGISAGIKDDLASIIGQPRIIPLYTTVSGNGNNAMYTIVAFVGIVITKVQLTGGDKYVTIQPCFCLDDTVITGQPVDQTSWFVYRPLALTR
jgi:hypothetical protein